MTNPVNRELSAFDEFIAAWLGTTPRNLGTRRGTFGGVVIVEVSCEECGHVLGYTPKSEFPDRAGAEQFVRRRRMYRSIWRRR